jgi:hypothetical protein
MSEKNLGGSRALQNSWLDFLASVAKLTVFINGIAFFERHAIPASLHQILIL